ncbi:MULTISPECIES: DUF72 domain-containing protein [unclassified Duganella]|uniref:DUF72 domain-containing protein n=1 Tax=unclassified Duganella TaxID=2636909 RepID=UPI0006F35DA4|nr:MULTISPECIES: DUF72 domain-containing protein [unclassified Duganella]KQV59697.1 hypothetical protein ASD07_23005 [Duganella sp. Root336D2]KRB87177.1 hypothetical protein ASE26_07205 [Duganella sp. Root198D2]
MQPVTIGIAGWGLPSADADLFPPASFGSNLARYAAVFSAVEINSSFYRPHRPETYARWADSVPAGFRFAVKLPKSITHEKRLQDIGPDLDRFVEEAGALGEKLGWVLVQTPPSLRFDARAAGALFSGIGERLGRTYQRGHVLVACEARHGSWFGDQATALLRETEVIRVIADPPAGEPGPFLATHINATYVRLHGSPQIYRSVYEPERLAQVASWLCERRGQDGSSLVIFDNTMSGTQLRQAAQLRQMLIFSSSDHHPGSHT